MRQPPQSNHDPYEILQVSRGASIEVIHAAYRVLARSYHPDLNDSPTAVRRMQELNAAYSALTDPQRRARLDAQVQMERARVAAARRTVAASSRRHAAPGRPAGGSARRSRAVLLALATALVIAALALIAALSMVLEVLDAPVSPQPIQHATAASQHPAWSDQPILNLHSTDAKATVNTI